MACTRSGVPLQVTAVSAPFVHCVEVMAHKQKSTENYGSFRVEVEWDAPRSHQFDTRVTKLTKLTKQYAKEYYLGLRGKSKNPFEEEDEKIVAKEKAEQAKSSRGACPKCNEKLGERTHEGGWVLACLECKLQFVPFS